MAAAEQETEIDIYIGKRLRQRRRAVGMSQVELATAIGVGFQQIQKYETAENGLSSRRLWEVSAALDVAPTYFFEGFQASDTEGSPTRSNGRRSPT
jgi:transcriptional regulator with XRE-family HTH domain